MVRITEQLLRKRAEHNEYELATLEEITLHQEDIERIEVIGSICRKLKILYLQSNLIPKIENVHRLKELEYINLALNNVKRIENLGSCESLKKLDLTINFVAELTSIESLRENIHLRELYLTGNPCSKFEGYRQYVVATLPQLKSLDGTDIERSERIVAAQEYESVKKRIIEQQTVAMAAQLAEEAAEKEKAEREKAEADSSNPPDGAALESAPDAQKVDFWHSPSPYTPQTRTAVSQHLIENVKKGQSKPNDGEKEGVSHAAAAAGPEQGGEEKFMQKNEGKWPFTLEESTDSEGREAFVLDVACPRFLDTSMIDADVQPTSVTITMKGKVLRLQLMEEVNSDSSVAKRSQTSGHLVITMPKAKQTGKGKSHSQPQLLKPRSSSTLQSDKSGGSRKKDVTGGAVDIANIVKDGSGVGGGAAPHIKEAPREKMPSESFVDDPDVPPLM
eukprot:Opistho-2@84038